VPLRYQTGTGGGYFTGRFDISFVKTGTVNTVEGDHGNGKQAFLTMLFRNCSRMLIFVLEEKV
jgi:hypothetical protein